MSGPLAELRVVELGGIGPAPHAATFFADLGADVVCIQRPSGGLKLTEEKGERLLFRGRRLLSVDLKTPEGRDYLLQLIAKADVLLEGYRPGVTERLGVGPAECLARNPRLIYGRVTGWGQDGLWAQRAGHDINYVGLMGALHAIGHAGERPVPPLNLVGDFGGGSMLLVAGVLAALWHRATTGAGQVVDAAMIDGTNLLSQQIWALRAAGEWSTDRGDNLLDSGAPFYDTYICADGRYVAVGALEPQFYDTFIECLGLAEDDLPTQMDRDGWPTLRARFTAVFASRTRDEWSKVFAETDACVTPVLTLDEAPAHEHVMARKMFTKIDGSWVPNPAPRFSRSVPGPPKQPAPAVSDRDLVLSHWAGEVTHPR